MVDRRTTNQYTDGGTTRVRRTEGTGDGATVRHREGAEPYGESEPRPVNRTAARGFGPLVGDVLAASSWNRTASGRLDGVDATQYETAGDRFGVEGFEDAEGAATFVVGERGVVRYVAYRFAAVVDGERTEFVYEAGYTEVGSTTVPEPSWSERAGQPERFANDGVLIAGRA